MRFSLRIVVQVISIIAFVLLFNVFLIDRYSERRDSDSNSGEAAGHLLSAREARRLPLARHWNPGEQEPDASDRGPDSRGNGTQPLSDSQREWDKPPGDSVGVVAVVKKSRYQDSESVPEGQPHGGEANYNIEPVLASAADISPSRPTELYDVFISVKTTKKFHTERLDLLLETWIPMAKEETFIFSDDDDAEYKKKTRGHLINTNCSAVHTRRALCCKMSVEFDYFIASGKRWFCHVDDDTYVNIPALYRLLRSYNHTGNWYLGKPSLTHPLEIPDIENPSQKTTFWFATGGAGFCISRGLALKMLPYTGGGKLKTVCEKIRLPDDCTIAFIIYYYLKQDLTVIPQFHSHLEGLWMIKKDAIESQITFSYARVSGGSWNVVPEIPGGFSANEDPSRFRSIHCLLYPNLKECLETNR